MAVGDDIWQDLERSVTLFTREVRQILTGTEAVERAKLEPLFEHHHRVVSLVNMLIKSSAERLSRTELDIELQSQKLANDATALLGSSFVLAAACALRLLTSAYNALIRPSKPVLELADPKTRHHQSRRCLNRSRRV